MGVCTFITSFLVFKQPHKVQNYGSHFRGGAPETQRVKASSPRFVGVRRGSGNAGIQSQRSVPGRASLLWVRVGEAAGSVRRNNRSARAQSFLYQPFQRSNTENLFDEPALVYQPIRKGQSWLAEDKAPGKTLCFSPGSRSVSF